LGISGGGGGNYGSSGPSALPLRGLGTKIFVGRLPPEATAEDLRRYFNNFGRISDVYVPKV
jgi:RNA-binding protein Musashi